MEKIGIAFYYKDLGQYPAAWVYKCIESIFLQTEKTYKIYVLDYGENKSLWTSFDMDFYRHKPLQNYAVAMNEIYAWIFQDCDVVVNTNIDDYYAPNRIEILLEELRKGADIASANFHVIDENNRVTWSSNYENKDILQELKNGFNPVSNPCHIMKKRVFEKLQFNPSLVPAEDMEFWIRALESGFKIVVRPEHLHYYRMHPGQETRRQNPGPLLD